MKQSDELTFLEAKLELLNALNSDPVAQSNGRLLFAGPIKRLKKLPKPPRARLINLERTMEQLMLAGRPRAVQVMIEDLLKKTFGYSSLGESPLAMVERILRQGNISTEDEARIVRDFISNQGNETVVGSKKFQKLAQLMIACGD